MKNIILVFIFFLCGCTAQTQIIEPDGSIYTIVSRTNAVVIIEDKNRKVTVNNQGKPTLFEAIITMMFMDANVKNPVTEDE